MSVEEIDPSIKRAKNLETRQGRTTDGIASGLGETSTHDDCEETTPDNLLVRQNHELDLQVKHALALKVEIVEDDKLPAFQDYLGSKTKLDLEALIRSSGLDPSLTSIDAPNRKNSSANGADLAFNVRGMARESGVSEADAAENLSRSISTCEKFEQAVATGSYVNIKLDFANIAPLLFQEVGKLGDRYGHFRDGSPQTVIIDYSSPNVAKNMTVAHLRSTIIGQSLMKLEEATGNIAFGINHIGDWGTQFGNIIYEYRKELRERGEDFIDELEDDPTATLMKIYRAFNERMDDDPEAVQEARDIFLSLENGDSYLVELWKQFREWSLRDFGPSYDRLRIKFDAIQGESFYEGRMNQAVQEGIEKGALRVNEDNAVIFPGQPLVNPTTGRINKKVMLDADGEIRDEIIVKPTGGTVYLTRDLAAIRYRRFELNADRILYVIGKEQHAHCLELFAMSDQLGYMPIGSAEHVSFGHLNVDGRKMKSREGKVVLLDEILDEAIVAASKLIEERKKERGDLSDSTDEEAEIARQVGISAVIFNDLKQNREKDIEFNPDIARTLEAGNSAYIQYTNSRLNSVIEKAGGIDPFEFVPAYIHPSERSVLTEIIRFPDVIKEAALRKSPHRIASYLTEFCQFVNVFYHDQPIMKAKDKSERDFRLHLVKAAQQVIANAAHLLHIELPDRM